MAQLPGLPCLGAAGLPGVSDLSVSRFFGAMLFDFSSRTPKQLEGDSFARGRRRPPKQSQALCNA